MEKPQSPSSLFLRRRGQVTSGSPRVDCRKGKPSFFEADAISTDDDFTSPVTASSTASSASSTLSLRERRKAFKAAPKLTVISDVADAASGAPSDEAHGFLAERYNLATQLGQGSVGVVYRAQRREDRQPVAVKVMRFQDEELLLTARQEFDILRSLQHPHIIGAVDFLELPTGAALVLEYFEGKSLEEVVRSSGCLTETTSQALFRQLLSAVAHLHQCGIVHRDVKGENILVSNNLADLRLVDFNTAKNTLQGGALTMTGTKLWMPPEVLLGESPSEASDVWSAGMCLYLMLLGKIPRGKGRCPSVESHVMTVKSVLKSSLKSLEASAACSEVLRSCLAVDAELRPAASELMTMQWLSSRSD
eukprot:TRINITY_DN42141_c0_g1_i1.p1 TRINITY_DN42141_c0_g1~~TRINITY_DN42141_c0_g1_i1.p1  ORF type:complete len:371 (-),score=94.32 TRINITY_DN42141_c0_g1_i1:64-1152(-)